MAETVVFSSSSREEEEEEFDGDFKEYMEREQLQWSRLESSGKPEDASADSLFVSDSHWEGIRWVFWSPQDDNFADFNPNAPAKNIAFWYRKSFLGNLYHVFQEQGLQCFDLYNHYEMRKQYENEDLKTVFTKIRMLMTTVCENHNLPLAFAWVPCGDCNALLRGHSLGYCENEQFFGNFIFVSHAHHLRKAQGVVGWQLSSPNLSYCSDVTQFSVAEYPLVPYARQCRLSACFAICLRSSCTANDMYVLEFFLPSSNKDADDSWASLSKILGTIKELFKNFKLASGQELGEELSVEAIEFPNGQKLHSVHSIKAGIPLPCLEPLQNGGGTMQLRSLDQPSRGAINNGTTVVSTEGNNISSLLPVPEGWQNGVVTMQLDSLDQPSKEAINCEMNFVNTEQNCVLVTSSEEEEEEEEEGTIKTRERDHKSTGVKIDISLEDILRCSSMTRDNAASELGVSISTLRHAFTVPHIRPHDPAFQDANMANVRRTKRHQKLYPTAVHGVTKFSDLSQAKFRCDHGAVTSFEDQVYVRNGGGEGGDDWGELKGK
ncbi:hypothetical protein Vadar_007813 [Vaccinium darrowii]|uniref:Uncharacterized protein n=1 Tax=Vaccinium darrowii TaxID=229202 RepID=A0ACB7XH63_9ERIC|nr:hypothetical protein Vadar_007813 [Vaccinium darrowii]